MLSGGKTSDSLSASHSPWTETGLEKLGLALPTSKSHLCHGILEGPCHSQAAMEKKQILVHESLIGVQAGSHNGIRV